MTSPIPLQARRVCANRQSASHSGWQKHAAKGFSLIEVLVAIVIVTFGILGAVGMQAFALRTSRSARLQAPAVGFAHELAGMMQNNKSIAVCRRDNPYLVSLSSPLTMASPSYCLRAASGCPSTSEMARAEMTDWLARVDAGLSGARVRVGVCFDSSPYDANGLAQWSCTDAGAEMAFIKIGWTRASTDKSQTGGGEVLEQASDADSRPLVVFPVTSDPTPGCKDQVVPAAASS